MPLDIPRWDEPGAPAAERLARATTAFVVLGMALRVVRYLTDQPIWGDEAYLASSLIDRGFLDLMRPLDYAQVAPLFFMWVELAIVRLLGFNEWALRLFPLLCGVATVPVFAQLARRTLGPVPCLLAVAIFAVAFYPIRHATEIKPYATDLLAALVLIVLAVEWGRDRASTRGLWALAAATPLALGFSYPAVFVAAGIALALLAPVWRTGRTRIIVAYLGLVLTMALSFAALYMLVIRGQAVSAGPGMHRYWASAFPPSPTEPLALGGWLIQTHTSRMFAYPMGEANGGSALTTVLVLVGTLAMARRGRRELLLLLIAPFGVGLLAAFLGRYPYGGSARIMQYVAPAICLLAGLGAARLLGGFRNPGRRLRWLTTAMAVLTVVGLAGVGMDLARPYKFPQDEQARRFARWFWSDQARDGELVCVRRDLATIIDDDHWMTGRSAVYLCNQRIYSPRLQHGQEPDMSHVSADRPLRCVLYNVDREHPDFAAWLQDMRTRYQIARAVTYEPVPMAIVGGLKYEDRYEVYDFVPLDKTVSERIAREIGTPARGASR